MFFRSWMPYRTLQDWSSLRTGCAAVWTWIIRAFTVLCRRKPGYLEFWPCKYHTPSIISSYDNCVYHNPEVSDNLTPESISRVFLPNSRTLIMALRNGNAENVKNPISDRDKQVGSLGSACKAVRSLRWDVELISWILMLRIKSFSCLSLRSDGWSG